MREVIDTAMPVVIQWPEVIFQWIQTHIEASIQLHVIWVHVLQGPTITVAKPGQVCRHTVFPSNSKGE